MTVRVQLSGILLKRPFGHQSTKWSKRYFIIKDGFLLYYQDNEKKEIEKRQMFNIHPRGVIALGGSEIESGSEQGHPFCMYIKNPELTNSIVIAAETEFDRDNWMEMLCKSARITWDNALLGESMIKQLEAQGLQMAKEKQNYFDQLQTEAKALHDEQQKTVELELVKEELQREKDKMEELTRELSEQYTNVKIELQETVASMQAMEDNREDLIQAKMALQENLEDLAKEKEKTLEELTLRQNEAVKLSKEKENLSEVTESLRKNLKSIEDQTRKITDEKSLTEQRLEENLERTQQMECEQKLIFEHVQELESSIKDITAQKAITEAELKEEVVARLEAERRLREAETSLKRLENAVHGRSEEGKDQDAVNEEMRSDVNTLKKFFENLAFEAKLDSDKSMMIKNSIHARKTMVRRAKTMKYQASKRNRSKGSVHSGAVTNRQTLTLPRPYIQESVECNNNMDPLSYRHSSIDLSSDTF